MRPEPRKIIFLLGLLGLISAARAQAQTDTVQLRAAAGQTSGRTIRGTINSESPTEIRIQVAGKAESVKTDDVESVAYGGIPPAYLEAEIREKNGDYTAAIDGFRRASTTAGLRPVVAQQVKYRYAESLANAAGQDPARTAEAVTALQEFVRAFPNGRNVPAALEVLLTLVRSGDDPARIDSVIADMAKIPGAQGRANLLKADLLVDRGQPDEALKQLSTARTQIAKGSDLEKTAQSIQIKALVGKKSFTEAEKLARDLIAAADPNDFESLAPAYNSLGDCLRAAGKPKDAMIAYLHTEILYDRATAEHARALASITELWRVLEKPDRAEQALSKLASTYPRSPWLKKAQGSGK
ncbi:MAG: tetratricopeptide repeat protein [bacterium]